MGNGKENNFSERNIIRCKGCAYYRSISGYTWMNDCACHYCIDTGKLRGYPAKDCYRQQGTAYAPKKKGT